MVFDSRDMDVHGEFDTIEPLQATGDPYDPFALQKACLLACGIIPREGHTLGEILERLGSGFVMHSEVTNVPKGSGLGTSSILSAACVKAVFEFMGIAYTEEDLYVFGFEESYGYLTGSYVRDKDGVDGAYMICEMFSYYATQGISLLDRLDELYKTYGYCLNTLHSYEFDGSAGFARMQSIMQAFRGGIKEFGGKKVVRLLDYVQGLDGLPKENCVDSAPILTYNWHRRS